jgi:predicted dehydrogenase
MSEQKSKSKSPAERFSRRQILISGGTAGAFIIVPRHVLGGRGFIAPSDKLNIAGIGVGGRGAEDIAEVASENIVALCDVDWSQAAETFKNFPQAKTYKDFRVMLEKEKGIDAVVVATPDHTHAVASMAAIHAGKHVYCEKPLTHTVYEARTLAKAAREAKVATQMGNQGMAHDANRQLKEWLWDGAIGPVREVHVWSDRPTRFGTTELWWPQAIERPKETPPVPTALDWDLWLGPAPWRPYHPAYVPLAWRGWWDFGTGAMGDLGIHNLAPVFTSLKLLAPTSVHASSTPVFPETFPLASMIHYEFPARGEMPPVKVHWYDGGLLPALPEEFEADQELPRENGVIFVGDKGKLLLEEEGGARLRFIPKSRIKDYREPHKTLPRSIGHHKEWIEACKGHGSTESNFEFAGRLTEALLLGNISIRLGGKKLYWDAANLQVTNCGEANQYLRSIYRSGWSL